MSGDRISSSSGHTNVGITLSKIAGPTLRPDPGQQSFVCAVQLDSSARVNSDRLELLHLFFVYLVASEAKDELLTEVAADNDFNVQVGFCGERHRGPIRPHRQF